MEAHPGHPQDQPRRSLCEVVATGEQVRCRQRLTPHLHLLLRAGKRLVRFLEEIFLPLIYTEEHLISDFFFNFLIKYDFSPTGGCVNTSRSQSAPPSSVWTGIPTTSCWLLDPVTSNAGTQMCYFICESILMTTLNTYNLLGLLSTLCMWHQFIFVCVTTVKEGKCCYFWSNQ